jgi:HK97 family phage major capsid protein
MTEPVTAVEQRGASDLLLAVRSANPRSDVDEIVEARIRAMFGEGEAGQAPFFARGGSPVARASRVADEHPYGAMLCAVAAAYSRTDGGNKNLLREYRDKPGLYAERHFGADSIAARALAGATIEDGGVFIPPDQRDDLMIDLLRPMVVVMGLGPQIVPMPKGAVEIPRVTGDVTAAYRGMGRAPSLSKPSFGKRALRSRALSSFVALGNELLARGGPRVAAMAEEIMAKRMAVTKDSALLNATGSEFSPKGLREFAGSEITMYNSTTPTFAQALSSLGSLVSALANADVNVLKGAIIVAPRTTNYLRYNCLTDLGVPFFLQMLEQGKLLGFPFGETNNVPTNLGGSANESYALMADMGRVYLGQEDTMALRVSTEASYTEDNEERSAFMLNETLMVVDDLHDLQIEHPEVVAAGTALKWGAA